SRRVERVSPEILPEKSENNRLTLKEESVIYATSRQSAKARRNRSLTIYQTICVGTQSDMDS
ncbi:hypothetical protein ACSFCW_27750, partial [Yokenella regensburgei]|uniref:hypothetical protein n=1 Tax=Yokenella regensburgei TaxID=158877 RepID=UPI003EDA1C08